MGKLQFFEMRAEEMATMYDATFTKKEAHKTGSKLVTDLLESGTVNKMEFGANLLRLNEVISAAVSTFRDSIIDIEKQICLGVEFTPINGGSTLNYSEDAIWQTLREEMEVRQNLLKIAQNETVFDKYGNEVPKVSTTPRKSSVTIKF